MISRLFVASWLALSTARSAPPSLETASPAHATATLTLPRKDGSVRFAVMGDTGRGSREQIEVAGQMAAFHEAFPFDFVIMLGDNIYGSDAPADMLAKFEAPYKPLLDAGVEFRASLGNHDNPSQRFYKLFNMGGQRFYSFRGPNEPAGNGLGSVRFFALDSNYLDQEQLDWLDKELAASDAEWRIAFFHHPLYSSGKTHGSALESRAILEPLFVKYGVSAVFSGHDHFYERIKPQKGGIVYWVSGAGGSLRKGDIRATEMSAKGFDSDDHFMIVEIVGDDLYFQAISRTGETIDSGVVHRPGAPAAAASTAPGPAPVPVAVPSVSATGRSTPEGERGLPPATPVPPATPPPR
jgi:3',5'-cyclic AMP phosphodiesterase CpdA